MPIDTDNLAIDARDVRVVRHGTVILDQLTAQVPRGTCTAILGPNGCGKTTFARTLLGQAFLTSGSIRVLGETLGQTDVRKLRQRIGIVNPTTDAGGYHTAGAVVDADLTTTEAVLTGYFATVGLYDRPTADQRDHASHLLEQVGLAHRLDHRFGTLSTGEQRRALIARALVHLPELLILDEPTAGLDIPGRERVLATVEQLLTAPNAPAVLMITHHVEELSPRTQQVLLMRDGRFLAGGRPKDIITPESLTETFGCKVYVRRIHGRYWLEVLPEAWLDLIR
ncbi:ABC transporter ATP-binding protein [Phycisphaerales bacterium AB-hyl4]|uniref:ABC transporter ATP-binding protein n=1 Tax=Natronomicrosphaera hydrolytica TaxID=3242702 RepID=A0ABV4U5W1_9BACT